MMKRTTSTLYPATTTQEKKSRVIELHLVTWDDFLPCHTDAVAEPQTPALASGNRRPHAHAALEKVLRADSNAENGRTGQSRAANARKRRPFSPPSISRRKALAKRKLAMLGGEVTESPLLHLATAELEVGNRKKARQLLQQVLQANPRSECGWLWMANAVDSNEEQRFCLEQVLIINHRNALARRRLEALTTKSAHSQQAGPGEPVKVKTEPDISKGRIFRLRAALEKYSIPITVIYLGVLVIAEALALVVPQGRLVLYGVLLTVLLTHTALTWGHSGSRLSLNAAFVPFVRATSVFLDEIQATSPPT
jgi:hypothetical protein